MSTLYLEMQLEHEAKTLAVKLGVDYAKVKARRDEQIADSLRSSVEHGLDHRRIVLSGWTVGIRPLSAMVWDAASAEAQHKAFGFSSVQKIKRPWWRFWR